MLSLKKHRSYALLLGVFLPLVAFSGCILVVEEDDFGRGHHLHGTSWYLEVLVIGGHNYHGRDHHYGIRFRSESEISGTAGCASFTAGYDLENNSIEISRVRTSTFGCEQDELGTMFLEHLPELSEVSVQDDYLTASARSGVQMVFTR